MIITFNKGSEVCTSNIFRESSGIKDIFEEITSSNVLKDQSDNFMSLAILFYIIDAGKNINEADYIGMGQCGKYIDFLLKISGFLSNIGRFHDFNGIKSDCVWIIS
jgi:hypothetical protein